MQHNTKISEIYRLNIPQRNALKKLGIETIQDLLYHFPTRYGDISEVMSIGSLNKGDNAVIFGKITKLKTSKGFKSKIPMADGWIEDESGKIHCVWFNQPYLAKMTPEGAMVRVEGKVSQRRKKGLNDETENGELYFSNPKLEIVNRVPLGVGDSLFGDSDAVHTLYPVYSESKGITSNWFYHKILDIFRSDIFENFTDPIPKDILDKYNLPSLKTALIWIHMPMKLEDAEAARKRFAFEEVFYIQIEKQLARREYEKNATFNIDTSRNDLDEFIKRFPFEATDAQKKAIYTIVDDFKAGKAMSRLLEGDVGSGKTAVAAATAYSVVTTKPNGRKFGNLQVAYMCPTEILATQHFESFIKYFSYLGIQVGLITGSGCRKFPSKINPKGWTDISKAQLLKWVENGEIPILIGTHALIQKNVKFKNLAYAIIDEQHRFGLKQRASLIRKDADGKMRAPHLLSMTATPIPRTLALTIYGDLDLTLLDQMPTGRKPIITEIIPTNGREQVYEKVKGELKNGRQLYVICPRIDEADPDKEMALNVKSVKEEAKRLKEKVFTEYSIGILHSKMSSKDKDKVMTDFKEKKINILCATSVVEVGVSVENATMIIIEGAERFGLAQLHQLRGRVIRSNHQAYCFVFADNRSDKTYERLNAMKNAKNGFELAEFDLKLRGAGELSGRNQWGVSDIAMEALKNIKMVEAAREEARILLREENDEMNKFVNIRRYIEERKDNITHWE